ncbi:MAG: hypothetical protein F6K55_44895 [Moorea sp. SIO4A3]|nr:hypothetical protein [Moorena sp. SIO4A3]
MKLLKAEVMAGCISFLLFDPVGGMGILVERASCPFHFRTGCPNAGGALRDGLSQHWRSRRKIRASPSLTHPTPFLFPIPYSLFPIPYSLFPIPKIYN